MPSAVLLIAEQFLDNHDIHPHFVHRTHDSAPVIGRQLLDIGIPMFPFEFAPTIEPRPSSRYFGQRTLVAGDNPGRLGGTVLPA